MTNLQTARENRDAGLAAVVLRRLWFWSPIVVGGMVAAVVLGSFAVPRWLEIGKDQDRLRELEQKQQEALLLQVQVKKAEADRRKAGTQRQTLIQLLTGTGNPSTFLATLDLEARQTGVRLQLFEPTPPPAPAPAPGAPGAPPASAGAPPPPDPLEQAGLVRRDVLLRARGTYPQLLGFLRRMELLDVLVEQSNLALEVSGDLPDGSPVNKQELEPAAPEVEVKLSLAFYEGKEKAPKPKPKPKTSPGEKPPAAAAPAKAP